MNENYLKTLARVVLAETNADEIYALVKGFKRDDETDDFSMPNQEEWNELVESLKCWTKKHNPTQIANLAKEIEKDLTNLKKPIEAFRSKIEEIEEALSELESEISDAENELIGDFEDPYCVI